MPDTSKSTGPNGKTQHFKWIAFCAILLFGAALRLYFFNGIRGHDDVVYLHYVRKYYGLFDVSRGQSLWGLRLFLILPILALFKMFGPGLLLAFLPTFTLSIATMLLSFVITQKIYSDFRLSLLVMFLMSFFPLDTFIATTLRGDVEVGFYATLSILLFILARRPSKTGNGSSLNANLLMAASGASAGIAYSCKEWGLVALFAFFIIFIADSMRERSIKWDFAFILLGFAAFYATESLFIATHTGDLFSRYKAGFLLYNRWYEAGNYINDRTLSFSYLPCLLSSMPTEFCKQVTESSVWDNTYTTFGPYFYFILGAFILLVVRKDKGSNLLMLWVAAVLVFFQFGTMSPFHYTLIHKEPRYLVVISVPSAILLARALYISWKGTIWLRIAVAVVTTSLLVSSLYILSRSHDKYTEFDKNDTKIWEFLKGHPADNVWTDRQLLRYLELKSGYGYFGKGYPHSGRPGYGSVEDLGEFNCERPGRGWLIFTRRSEYLYIYPDKKCLHSTQDNWIPMQLFENGNARAEIYYVP